MRVLAALSGGVDSAVAAALAVQAGHEVVGVHMALTSPARGLHADPPVGSGGSAWNPPGTPDEPAGGGCCTTADALDARRSADVLGLPFEVWDFSAEFAQAVVADCLAEYAAGRTPNPCVRCNENVKLAALVDRARAAGYDAVCTGHYARVDRSGTLRRAVYQAKDQSYVVAVGGRDRLSRMLFPLGTVTSKDEVRAQAAALGLPVAAKRDSVDLCFVADGDLRGFLRRRLGSAPGEIVATDGTVVGQHDGTYGFTIGQRRGLALGRPAPDGRPRYVLAVEPAARRVVVGPVEALDVTGFVGTDAVWFDPPAAEPVPCGVQVRAHATPVPGTVVRCGTAGGVEVSLTVPERGVAPGQSAVCYDGNRVVVQATIAETRNGR
ncbi:MAG: tRNA 2-thiouridine(34) synthase MnmA [Micrococcales bacterium]|nr:tRNA 2-thiouridine(34) synthase MnmA [Micrococcales bacterium]